jgi:hypothetical protein
MMVCRGKTLAVGAKKEIQCMLVNALWGVFHY